MHFSMDSSGKISNNDDGLCDIEDCQEKVADRGLFTVGNVGLLIELCQAHYDQYNLMRGEKLPQLKDNRVASVG